MEHYNHERPGQAITCEIDRPKAFPSAILRAQVGRQMLQGR
jgi:hypothetical protein